jgi:ligand-binding sensor protein
LEGSIENVNKISGIFETLTQVAACVMKKMGVYCSNFFVFTSYCQS